MDYRKLIALLLFAASPLLAEGPLFKHEDKFVNQEFMNAYNDIRGPHIASGTAQNFTIGNASITVLSGPAGNGFKIKTTEFTDTGADVTTSAAAYSDTNLTSGSYTPFSATSNILVIVNQGFRSDFTATASAVECDARLMKDAVAVRTWINASVARASPSIGTSAFAQFSFVGMYLDTSHSASARTYKTQFQNAGAAGVCRSNSGAFGGYMYVIEYEPRS